VSFDAFDYKQFTILVRHVDENNRVTRLLILEHDPETMLTQMKSRN